jgi:predicted nuclease with TOPRIM domain
METFFRRYVLCPLIYGVNYSSAAVYMLANHVMYNLFRYQTPSVVRMIELREQMKQHYKSQMEKEKVIKEELLSESAELQEQIDTIVERIDKINANPDLEDIHNDIKQLSYYTKKRIHNTTQMEQILNNLRAYFSNTSSHLLYEADKDVDYILRTYYNIVGKFSRSNN